MRILLKSALLFILSLTAYSLRATDFVDYASPLVGTASSYELSAGNTYPVIAMPWGMNFWTPQTGKMGDGWVYRYTDHKIRGFKQTHQPSPWINDYGQFSLMPMTGRAVFDEDKRASWFSHKAETVAPYYYKVYLADYDVTTEIAPTERAAMFRITYPDTDSAFVVIDAFDKESYVRVEPEAHRIVGYTTRNSGGVPKNFRNYFVVEFISGFSHCDLVLNGRRLTDLRTAKSHHSGAIVSFSACKGAPVVLRVASSFISEEQALRNLEELGSDDFDTVKEKGKRRWNDVLSRIEVQDTDVDRLRTFYSCLYRSLLFPRQLAEYDADGRPWHYSPYNGQVLPGLMYTDTGFWDTFRSLFPLLNLLYPEVSKRVQEGLVNAYQESGFLPEWASPGHRDCMVGNNSASVVADAYLKGVRIGNIDTLWQAVVHGANAVHPTVSSTGRQGFQYYNRLGFVPYDVKINESVARTLEYAYDDWCIYQLGKALGKSAREIDVYRRRALNYRKVFDRETSLMRGKNKNGRFQQPFNPLKWGDAFTEGNSWHYTWSVFHDPQGLIDLMGGRARFNAMMDSVFRLPPVFDDSYYGQVIHEIREMQVMNMGNYAHGNQPIQHQIYLYDWSGQPWKTQCWVREVMNRLYSAAPDGYCGDEYNGQTSAWYVFSALGFYPVCPATDQYAIGAPLFRRALLHLTNGRTVTLSAPANSDSCRYIGAIRIDGKSYTKTYFTHDELLQGPIISFDMRSQPVKTWGTGAGDVPYSFTNYNYR